MPGGCGSPLSRADAHLSGAKRLGLRLAVIALVVAVCTPGTPSRSALQGDPASKLRMPSAVELLHFGGDNQMTLDGPLDAWDGYIFGVPVDAAEVLAFYDRELARLGWSVDPLRLTQLSTETEAKVWCRSLLAFRIGIKDQARAFQPDFYRGQTFRTVYEARITAQPPGTTCPARPGG